MSEPTKVVNIPIDNSNEYRKYTFARGFLLSPEKVIVHENWVQTKIRNNYLTFDPQNDYSLKEKNGKIVAVLGFLLDLKSNSISPEIICDRLLTELCKSYEKFIEYQDTLCGRYCIFYSVNETDLHLMQDPTGMRSAYYSENKPIAASHYNLIKDYIEDVSPLPYYSQYLKLKNKPWLLPGNYTPWVGIKELFANHELNITNSKMKRFWPYKDHDNLSINEVNDIVSDILQKQVELLLKHKKLVVSLTAGNDSRLTTSLLKKYRDSLLFYTYTSSSDPKKVKDCAHAAKIADDLGLKFIPLDLDEIEENDEQFVKIKEVTTHNHYHRHVPKAIPLYFNKLPSNRIHLQSNLIEIIRELDIFESMPVKSNAKDLVHKLYPMDESNPLVIEMFEKYYADSDFGNVFNYLSADIIFWEYRLGEWLNGAVLVETDFVYDTYMLFNCRRILEAGLSSPRFFKRNNTIAYHIVRNNWPETYFNIPNTEYDLYDIADSDSSRIELGTLAKTFSSSIDQEVYKYPGRYSLELGYAKGPVTNESFVKTSFTLPLKLGKIVDIEIELVTPKKTFLASNVTNVSIKINNEEMYTTDISERKGFVNLIDISRETGDCDELKIEICIYSLKSYVPRYGSSGHIIIKGIRINYRDAGNGPTNYIRSSKDFKEKKFTGPFIKKRTTISILGSCVSRDIFNLDYSDSYKVTSYVQHHHPALLLQKNIGLTQITDEDIQEFSKTNISESMYELLKHDFNKRMFKSLVNNNGKELLLKNKGEWIILDTFYSFPSKMLEITNSTQQKYYIQDNLFYSNISKMAILNNKFKNYSVRIIDACPNIEILLDELCKFLKDTWGNKIIVINTKPCKEQLSMVTGIKKIQYDASEESHSNKLFHALIQRLHCHSIEIPDYPMSRDGYSVHYIGEVMGYLKRSIDSIIIEEKTDYHQIYAYNIDQIKKGNRIDSFVGNQYLNHIFDKKDPNMDVELMPIVSKMIAQGHYEGYAQLGRMQRFGRGTNKDLDSAQKNLTIASEHNIVWATIELFDLQWYNNRMTAEIVNKIEVLAQSNKRAKVRLARVYAKGVYREKQLEKAEQLLKEANAHQSIELTCELFDVLWEMKSTNKQKEAFSLVSKYINTNNPDILVRIAKYHKNRK